MPKTIFATSYIGTWENVAEKKFHLIRINSLQNFQYYIQV